MNEEDSVEQRFYMAVAEALECDYSYNKYPYERRTRWNNRMAGNGRYADHGIVRRFSSDRILVQLHTPKVNGVFASLEAVLESINIAKALI
jgi:hypothetical protein